MTSITLSQGAAVLATLLLMTVSAYQVSLAAGLPLGRAAWGGHHRVLPVQLRWGSLAGAIVLCAAAWIVLARADLAAPGAYPTPIRIAVWSFAGLFTLNTLGNLASKSRPERYVMTPATLLLVICFALVALTG